MEDVDRLAVEFWMTTEQKWFGGCSHLTRVIVQQTLKHIQCTLATDRNDTTQSSKFIKNQPKPKQKHSNHQGFVGLCSCSYRTLHILSREHEQEVILCVHAHHRIHFLGLQQILGWAGRGMFMKYYILPTVLSNLFEPAGRLRNYLEAAIRPPPTIRGSHWFLVRRRRPPLPQWCV